MSVMALSHSRITDFRTCPLKFKLKYIDKADVFKQDASKSPHLVRGTNVHAGLEKYIIKKNAGEEGIRVSTLDEVEKTKPLIDGLMSIYTIHPEQQVAVDVNFKQVDWFSKDAWFRVIYDMIGFGSDLFLGDFKTGKLTDYSGTLETPGQLHLSALIALAVWPTFEDVNCVYIYVDHKKTVPLKLNRTENFEILRDKLVAEHNQINAEQDWQPCVNKFCMWCEATKDLCCYSRKVSTSVQP